MAVRVGDKIKQLNDNNFYLMDAKDVELTNGKSVEDVCTNLPFVKNISIADTSIAFDVPVGINEDGTYVYKTITIPLGGLAPVTTYLDIEVKQEGGKNILYIKKSETEKHYNIHVENEGGKNILYIDNADTSSTNYNINVDSSNVLNITE